MTIAESWLQEGIAMGKAETMTIAESWLQEGIAKGKAEGKAEGLEVGLRQKALEDARKMLTRGCEWAFITDITGIVPEDIA
jgi:flagellar biosynthesis/type III secretory pathway protein FliH